MSTLLLIRHGQARAFDADSDKLTDKGIEQAKRLGDFLVEARVELDEVVTGTLERQRHTAALVGEAFAAAGRAFPVPEVDARFNEYDAGGILGTLLPALTERDEAVKRLSDEFQAAAGRPDRNRYFQRLFEALMDAWQSGALTSPGVESFEAFHARARDAFRSVTSRGGSRRVAVFTSGGPIGVCLQEALEAPPRTALRVNWRVKNASLTEMTFSEGRVSVDSFNVVLYLPPELRTFR
ncbi:MAG TPA: histidine phosphatase family protein [Polyangiaceae bacterium]|jgi:broad specificity phosphatase PhoE|nr:histidine phosphatase family protein [Polyangiaceae bacterium]